MDSVVKAYERLFYEQADPRVQDWLLMKSPWPVLAIVSTYLLLIKVCLPSYMKNRKPVDLRQIIKCYNVMQIVANAVVTWGILTSGWTTTYHFGCVLPDYSMKPEPLRMLRFLWWTMVLKLLELTETTFFILRKKESQASFLHVYHHCSSFIIMWVAVKFIGGICSVLWLDDIIKAVGNTWTRDAQNRQGWPKGKKGGMTSFPPMLNNAVHVVMYSYYLLSAEGSPGVKRFLAKYKKWITIMQMVQFTVMLIYSVQVFLPSCPAPLGITYMYFPNVIFVYYMFYDFFNKSYVKKSHTNGNGTIHNGNGLKVH